METLAKPEVYGIGAIAIAVIVAVYKTMAVYLARPVPTDNQKILIQIVQENAKSNSQLASAVQSLEKVVEQNTKSTDTFSALLINMMKQ